MACVRLVAVLAVVGASSALSFSQDLKVAGKVDRVTLYRGQALVTRLIAVDGAAAAQEIVVTGLPERVVPTSLFAEAEGGIEVRAVRFRSSAVSAEPREAVREIDLKLEALAERAATTARAQALLERRLATLDKLENFVAPAATVELSKGILDSAQLEKLVLFNFEQRKRANDEIGALAKEAKEIETQAELLKRQRAELTQGGTKTLREGVVFVEKRRAGPASVRLSYVVDGCGWAPSYNFRAGGDLTAMDVECNALIHQMSGEDWGDVEITLSTATPGLNAAAPAMAPFVVDLRPAEPAPSAPKGEVADAIMRYKSIQQQLNVAAYANRIALNPTDNANTNWAMNAAANACQTFEILEAAEVIGSIARADDASEGPSLSYPLDSRVSLASRPDQQLVRIAAVKLKCAVYLVANPVLTPFVYREAEIANSSAVDFLGGPMNVYLDGRFVGRGDLESVARGQKFVVGLGVDPQVRARREQAEKADRVQGGNKMLALKYRLVVENFKDVPVTVRIQDRVPHADREESLRVMLGEMSAELSKDPTYLRLERPMGILRWEVQAPASASGDKAFMLTYAYTVEHDRNLGLAAAGTEANQKAQQDFERLLKQQRQGK